MHISRSSATNNMYGKHGIYPDHRNCWICFWQEQYIQGKNRFSATRLARDNSSIGCGILWWFIFCSVYYCCHSKYLRIGFLWVCNYTKCGGEISLIKSSTRRRKMDKRKILEISRTRELELKFKPVQRVNWRSYLLRHNQVVKIWQYYNVFDCFARTYI